MAQSANPSAAEMIKRVLSEIQSGDGLSLSAAGALFPAHRGEGTADASTVVDWIQKGTKIGDQVVKLEAVRVGGRWLTSKAAIERFVTTLTTSAMA